MRQLCGLLFTLLFAETLAEKKDCWYFEGDYPVYFICKTYEDCCGTQCCVRALSAQRIWFFYKRLLLIIGILCCCSTGYFIRRRVHPYPPPGEPDFNVAFTRYPIMPPGLHQTGFHSYGDSETAVISTVYPVQTHPRHMTAVYPVQTHPRHMTAVYPVQTHPRHMTAVYPVQTHPRHMTAVFSALPYSQPPPPPYDQAIQDSQKK